MVTRLERKVHIDPATHGFKKTSMRRQHRTRPRRYVEGPTTLQSSTVPCKIAVPPPSVIWKAASRSVKSCFIFSATSAAVPRPFQRATYLRSAHFFRFCIENQWVERNPALFLKAPLVKDKPTLPFSRAEMAKNHRECWRITSVRSDAPVHRYAYQRRGDAQN